MIQESKHNANQICHRFFEIFHAFPYEYRIYKYGLYLVYKKQTEQIPVDNF